MIYLSFVFVVVFYFCSCFWTKMGVVPLSFLETSFHIPIGGRNRLCEILSFMVIDGLIVITLR